MPSVNIFCRYTGNTKGDKLTVFKEANSYRFIYQTYVRTNPSQQERKLGFKPKRIIQSEHVYEFENLKDVDFSSYPFSHLMTDFKINEPQP